MVQRPAGCGSCSPARDVRAGTTNFRVDFVVQPSRLHILLKGVGVRISSQASFTESESR